ncbi:hypothetical protein [Natrinema sp. SYSU A 869]|uniref:hypothetical protein n=1 Tax=Natrinema sp. SYSU A 869 TaxID=2871694 RepID=UPI001CA3A739|nr:hypothetical protein [Natrinema sp. SYSU A 869]
MLPTNERESEPEDAKVVLVPESIEGEVRNYARTLQRCRDARPTTATDENEDGGRGGCG